MQRRQSRLIVFINQINLDDDGVFVPMAIILTLLLAVFDRLVRFGICVVIPLMRILFEGPEVLKEISPISMHKKRTTQVIDLWEYLFKPVGRPTTVVR